MWLEDVRILRLDFAWVREEWSRMSYLDLEPPRSTYQEHFNWNLDFLKDLRGMVQNEESCTADAEVEKLLTSHLLGRILKVIARGSPERAIWP